MIPSLVSTDIPYRYVCCAEECIGLDISFSRAFTSEWYMLGHSLEEEVVTSSLSIQYEGESAMIC